MKIINFYIFVRIILILQDIKNWWENTTEKRSKRDIEEFDKYLETLKNSKNDK